MELRVEGLKKKYKKQEILKGISFTAYSGECIGFVGKNGCGKTTLLTILSGILKADEGRIVLDGKVINKANFAYDKVKDAIIQRFSMLSSILAFIPLEQIMHILVPVCFCVGAGIGLFGSLITVRRHLRVSLKFLEILFLLCLFL